jgi:ferredoxin-NADP reductase
MTGTWHPALFESEEISRGITSFRFGKPGDYSFAPGQYFSLTLETREGAQTKAFTHSESPGDPFLELTTRMSGSAFKDALQDLRPGDSVTIAGPRGSMVVPAGVSKVAFLTGGVGITPARSIIRDAVQRETGLQVALLYGNQNEAGIAFREELDSYAAALPEIEVVHVLAEPGPGWRGERGLIGADVVRRHVVEPELRHWFVAGPPAMVDAMRQVVGELAIPAESVSVERFSGYADPTGA